MNPTSLRRARTACGFLFLAIFFPTIVLATAPPKEGLRHGSRAKAADGTLVVYDKVNGIFLVPGHDDTYWADDHFYQYVSGVWLTSNAIAGPWELAPQHIIPDPALDRYEPPKTQVTAKLPWGHDAVYEPKLKSYKIAGRKGVFLFDGRFYRYEDGIWYESKKDEGPWTPTSAKILPVPLRKAVPAAENGTTVKLPSGETVVFDAEKKMFHVENKPDTLLFDGTFYERRDDKWFSAPGAAQGFQEVADTKIPPPVRMLYRKPADPDKKKGEGKTRAEKGEKKKNGEKPAKKAKNPDAKAGAKKHDGAKAKGADESNDSEEE